MNNFIDEKTKELYTFLGAQARLQQLDRERADILRAYPHLDGAGTEPKKKTFSKATIKKLSEKSKEKWANPAYRKRQLKARRNKRANGNGQATP